MKEIIERLGRGFNRIFIGTNTAVNLFKTRLLLEVLLKTVWVIFSIISILVLWFYGILQFINIFVQLLGYAPRFTPQQDQTPLEAYISSPHWWFGVVWLLANVLWAAYKLGGTQKVMIHGK